MGRIDYSNKHFKEIFKIKIPYKEETVTPHKDGTSSMFHLVTGKENYLKCYNFKSIYSSAMVRAYICARTGEINVCDHKIDTGCSSSSITSSNNIGYIYTIGIEYDVELEQKQRSIHSFL